MSPSARPLTDRARAAILVDTTNGKAIMLYPVNYTDLAREAVDDGGFTRSLDGFRPEAGYVVSTREDAERTIKLENSSADVQTVADALYVFVIDHGYDLRHGFLLGAWRDDDSVVIDLVQVFEDRSDAERAARAHSQAAYFDIESNDTIWVDPPAFEVVGLVYVKSDDDNGRGDELNELDMGWEE